MSLLGTAESSRATKYSYRGSGPAKALVQKRRWAHSGGYVIRPRSRLRFLPYLLYSPLILSESSCQGPQDGRRDVTSLDPPLPLCPSSSAPSPASTTSSLALLHQSLILCFFQGRGLVVHQTGTLTLCNTKLISLPGREEWGPRKPRGLSLRHITFPQECTEKRFSAEEGKNSFKTFHFKFHIPFHLHEFRSKSSCF